MSLITPAPETGFELVNTSIQVFEKKAKASEDNADKAKGKASTEIAGSSGEGDRGEKSPKKKRLIDSVRIG